MKIQTNFLKTILLTVTMLLSGMAAAVEGQLLGVTTGHPLIDTNVDTALSCGYVGNTLTLQSQAAAITFTPGGTTALIFSDNTGTSLGGLLDITAQIDNAGNLISGTFTVTGAFLDGSVFGDPNAILAGDIVDFGIVDGGATDAADFRVQNLSGDLLTHVDWPAATTDVGVIVDLATSDYTAANGFGSNWNCVSAKTSAGPTAAGAQGCNLIVAKTAVPNTVGPEMLGSDTDDSDSDSGRDHNNNGDSDDSDSSSEVDSADSDDPNLTCGCKGRVTELTLRWNSLNAETVMVENNKGVVLFAATLVQPNEIITFPVTGKKITLYANGAAVETLKVKCKFPIGPGQAIGDFVVVSGKSKAQNALPLCAFPGTTCGPEFDVTYSYDVTNTGPGNATNVTLYDDQLGIIDSFATNAALVSIPAGGTVTVTSTVCVFDTTTNVATAFGTSDSTAEACTFDPTGNTATVYLLPPPCAPDDSDSDSHVDADGSGDTDDSSDSDSGPGDCDGDGT